MEKVVVSPNKLRGDYTRIADTVARALGLSVEQLLGSYKIMPFTIKMAAYLSPNNSVYQMSPRKGVDPLIGNVQQLLDQNDWHAVTGISVRIGRAAFASNVYSNWGNYPVMTYPDPNFFNGTGTTAGSEAAGLQTLVNGTLSVAVNNDSVIDPTPAQDFFFNPMATYTATPLAYPQFGGSQQEKGYKDVEPLFILDASADNSFQISCALGARGNIDGSISTGTTDSGIRNILYLFVDGFKIKNLGGAGANLARTC